MTRVLVCAYTVSEWGGLQENVLGTVRSLGERGVPVCVVASSGPISNRLRSCGAEVVETDWSNDSLGFVSADVRDFGPDLILAQTQRSRELSLLLAHELEVPVFVQFQGYYPDQVSSWKDDVEAFTCVSDGLAALLSGYGQVDPWRITTIPNGVDDWVIDQQVMPIEERVSDGSAHLVIASRLDEDKEQQWVALERVVPLLSSLQDVDWTIRVLGDGGNRSDVESRIARAVNGSSRTHAEFLGWLDQAAVVAEMRRAVMSVGAGRAALTSLAVGTPCVGAGKSSVTGLAEGLGVRLGLWSNFGDYPTNGAELSVEPIEVSVPRLLSSREQYARVQEFSHSLISGTRRQSFVDSQMMSFLGIS